MSSLPLQYNLCSRAAAAPHGNVVGTVLFQGSEQDSNRTSSPTPSVDRSHRLYSNVAALRPPSPAAVRSEAEAGPNRLSAVQNLPDNGKGPAVRPVISSEVSTPVGTNINKFISAKMRETHVENGASDPESDDAP